MIVNRIDEQRWQNVILLKRNLNIKFKSNIAIVEKWKLTIEKIIRFETKLFVEQSSFDVVIFSQIDHVNRKTIFFNDAIKSVRSKNDNEKNKIAQTNNNDKQSKISKKKNIVELIEKNEKSIIFFRNFSHQNVFSFISLSFFHSFFHSFFYSFFYSFFHSFFHSFFRNFFLAKILLLSRFHSKSFVSKFVKIQFSQMCSTNVVIRIH